MKSIRKKNTLRTELENLERIECHYSSKSLIYLFRLRAYAIYMIQVKKFFSFFSSLSILKVKRWP